MSEAPPTYPHAHDRSKEAHLKGETDVAIASSEDSDDNNNPADLDGERAFDEEVSSDFSTDGPSDTEMNEDDLHASGAP